MQGIERILALQEIDTAVDRLTARRGALESGQALVGARAEADAAEHVLGDLRLQADEMSRDQGRFEHEIDSLTQKETAEQTRMYDGSVANAKELEALQHEVESLKRRRTDREDELLALLELRENLDRRIAEADARTRELRSQADATNTATSDELVAVMSDLESRNAGRAELAPQLDPELLELYEDLRRQKKGVGAAALVDGICQGCHEKLSAMELDKIKRAEGIRRCEHCRRILVL